MKDKCGEMKNQLHDMVLNCEKSGNGGMQRSFESKDWGSFNFEDVVDGDDRSSFLPRNDQKLFCLLCHWQRLDEEGHVQFTLAKLPAWMKANSGQFALTSPPNKRPASNEKVVAQLALSIETVGDSIATHAVASVGRNLMKHQRELFAVQLKMASMDESTELHQLHAGRKKELERCIEKVEADEEAARKRLKKSDD